MTLQSIEKLRESLKDCTSEAGIEPNRFDTYWITARACDMLIDEVEAEIAEKYIELPVDSDGVLIRIGDTVRELDDCVPMKVMSLTFYEDCVDVNACGMNPNLLRHVNPRTLEDVLRDFAHKAVRIGMKGGVPSDVELYADEDAVAECAVEIRDLLGGDGR